MSMDGPGRKAAIRAYKESARPMGIFRVRNTGSERSLVGASRDLPAMLNRQRAQLRGQAHGNRALQRDWNELGAEAFAFEVLDTLEPRELPGYDPADDLRALLELWREKLLTAGEALY